MNDLTYHILMNPAAAILINLAVLALGGFGASKIISVERPLRRVSFLLLMATTWFLIPVSMFPWLMAEEAAKEGMLGVLLAASLVPILIYGVLVYAFSARRSIDMTGTRRKAWMGFIPVINLVLMFTPGQNATERRKERTSFSRFVLDPLLIVVAMMVFTLAELINRVFEETVANIMIESPALTADIAGRTPVEEFLDLMVTEAKATLPTRVDEITILTGVSRQGEMIRYRYTVERDIESLSPEFGDKITRTVCAGPSLGQLIERGASVIQSYENRSGSVIGEYRVARADCEMLRLY